ncbi:benzoate/H(+) symporter BenE family transporter [Cupriavidus pauculus]|uniref:Benzoate transporter n=1 Tax=Cupriavidus pauculus TaxID=82633 RepID=A0A2N5C3C0_9BURK|nr:benzoate/H(+) symporter BenE family transporter [Cupriavidus pauculus]PLP96715.1 benzoate transporter [Cupriavidus pauculus]
MIHRDVSLSAVSAGLLAVVISYAGPVIIFFQAGQSAHVSPEMMASWVWAISIGAGISGVLLSWFLKVPAMTAWSAPGAALLVTQFPGVTINQAVGAYIICGAAIALVGMSGYFDKLMKLIPKGIASAMMAGILMQFGVKGFQSVESMPLLALSMFVAYIIFKRLSPRYCLVLLLAVGVTLAVHLGGSDLRGITLTPTKPVFIEPQWSWASTLSLTVPLILVTIAGQFLPAMAILRGSGYTTSAKPILSTLGLLSIPMAFYGGVTIAIAAITGALGTSRNAHENPEKRYVAGIANGIFFLIGGCFAGTIIQLFAVMPKTFVAVLAGLALLGAITSNVMGTVNEADHREAAIIAFLATSSGMNFYGLGSAFWGGTIGVLAYLVLHKSGWWAPKASGSRVLERDG